MLPWFPGMQVQHAIGFTFWCSRPQCSINCRRETGCMPVWQRLSTVWVRNMHKSCKHFLVLLVRTCMCKHWKNAFRTASWLYLGAIVSVWTCVLHIAWSPVAKSAKMYSWIAQKYPAQIHVSVCKPSPAKGLVPVLLRFFRNWTSLFPTNKSKFKKKNVEMSVLPLQMHLGSSTKKSDFTSLRVALISMKESMPPKLSTWKGKDSPKYLTCNDKMPQLTHISMRQTGDYWFTFDQPTLSKENLPNFHGICHN